MAENNPLYEPGYSLQVDGNGNIFDGSLDFVERHSRIGNVWRLETGYISIAAGASTYITFTTPATGDCLYRLSSVDKSGDEVVKSLVRAGTLVGGTASVGFNENENIADTECPLTSVYIGGTLTGGTERFISMAPGTSLGSSQAGASARSEGYITLKKSTQYSLKLTSVTGAATITSHINILYLED